MEEKQKRMYRKKPILKVRIFTVSYKDTTAVQTIQNQINTFCEDNKVKYVDSELTIEYDDLHIIATLLYA